MVGILRFGDDVLYEYLDESVDPLRQLEFKAKVGYLSILL